MLFWKLKLSTLLLGLGTILISSSLTLFILIFFPIFSLEVNYQINQAGKLPEAEIKAADEDFGIVIPKINASSKVIANVNPYNEKEYQWALTKGVAQAKGTAFPGEVGNIFLFSHSSVNFYEANIYNSIFYLINKLEKDDQIDLYYKKQKYIYKVVDKKIVEANDIQYLNKSGEKKRLTLMTCWPPGTTIKRLLILAEIKE